MEFKLTVLAALAAAILTACGTASPAGSGNTYEMMTVSELQALRESNEEFLFINVHIPLEGNIPGTDFTVPFNEVEENLDLFPADKDAKIVIYCRSDNMGHDAAQALVDNGYTDVYNLEGGYVEWQANGLPFE